MRRTARSALPRDVRAGLNSRSPRRARQTRRVVPLARLGEMVAPVVREIRNPLAILAAASGMLADELGPRHQCSGYARLLRATSDRAHEAVSDLSILALPARFQATITDVGGLLARCRRRFDAEARRAGVRMRLECPAPLRLATDPAALELAFTRLFQQALAAMPEGGELRVRAEPAGRDAGHRSQALIRFADTGPDVPEERLPDLFHPFVIAGARRPEMRLAVCRSLIVALGGQMAARNLPEGGLEIELRLPSGGEQLN